MFGFMHVLAGALHALETNDRQGCARRLQSPELGFQQHGAGAWTWFGGQEEHDQEVRLPVPIRTPCAADGDVLPELVRCGRADRWAAGT